MFNKSKKGGNRHLILMHNYATIWKKGDEKMPRIIPIRELRDTNRMSEMCHESEEPDRPPIVFTFEIVSNNYEGENYGKRLKRKRTWQRFNTET